MGPSEKVTPNKHKKEACSSEVKCSVASAAGLRWEGVYLNARGRAWRPEGLNTVSKAELERETGMVTGSQIT